VAISLYEKNVENFDACLGCYKTAATVAVATLATKYQKPFINIYSTADICTAEDTPYVFKTCLGETEAVTGITACLQFLATKDDHEYSKVAQIYTSDDFCQGMGSSLKSICADMGWEVVVDEMLQVGQTSDASTSVNKVKNSGADLLCTTLSVNESVIVQKQLREYRCSTPVFSASPGYYDPNFFANVDGAAEYVVGGALWTYDLLTLVDPSLKALEYAEMIAQASGLDFCETNPPAWESMGVLLQAIDDSPSLSADDICATLDAIDLPAGHFSCLMTQYPGVKFEDSPGVAGTPIRYNQNVRGSYVFCQVQDEYWKVVFSPATGEPDPNPLVWPHAPYNE